MLRTRKVPVRMCIACRQRRDKKELLRFVRTPEANVIIDPTGKKSGRGAYLCLAEECLLRAIKNKSLERALKVPLDAETVAKLKAEFQKTMEVNG